MSPPEAWLPVVRVDPIEGLEHADHVVSVGCIFSAGSIRSPGNILSPGRGRGRGAASGASRVVLGVGGGGGIAGEHRDGQQRPCFEVGLTVDIAVDATFVVTAGDPEPGFGRAEDFADDA